MFAFVQKKKKNHYIKYNTSNTAFYQCNKTRKKKKEQERKSDMGGGRDTSNIRIM